MLESIQLLFGIANRYGTRKKPSKVLLAEKCRHVFLVAALQCREFFLCTQTHM